jgi:murein DD-endopeptidase MepM/ murein hydrolase activator NlpD
MSANEYNNQKLKSGDLSVAHVTELVSFWQRHHSLAVDGYAGPNTVASIEAKGGHRPTRQRYYPLLCLPDGRKPVITSGFYTENPDRPSHKGVDFFYKWLDSDPDVPVGDGGAIKRNGKRLWWYPPERMFPGARMFIAPVAGTIQKAGEIGTGHRIWLQSGMERVGGFHLKELFVCQGEQVAAGEPLGVIGDSPKGHDAAHLHFEVSPVARYAPQNPRKWLEGATYLTELPEEFR